MRRRYLVLSAFLAVAIFALVAVTTATARSLEYALVGIAQLERGKSLLVTNPPEARIAFTSASASFNIASGVLLASPWYSKLLTPLPPFRWHVQLMRASRELAHVGESATSLSSSFPPISLDQPDVSTLLQQITTSYSTWEEREAAELDRLERSIVQAKQELDTVPSWVFFSKAGEITEVKRHLTTLSTVVPEVRKASSEFQRVLGKNDSNPHQVVLFFQNSAELRPCGGFPGSFATLTASSGRIRNFSFGTNIYKLDRPYERISGDTPPLHLQTITSFMGFVNSCSVGGGFLPEYSPNVMRTFSAASSTSPEGYISINSSLLSDLLEITGPLKLPNGVTATAETITTEITREVEQTYYTNPENVAINEPKSILNELIPILLTRLGKTKGVGEKTLSLVQDAIRAKEIQFWFNDQALQTSLEPLTPRDTPLPNTAWVKLVNSNLAGMKSSEKTHQKTRISVASSILSKETTYILQIERTHTGDGAWPDAINRNYLEAYLPPEARIVSTPTPIGGDYTIDGGLLIQNNLTQADQSSVRIEDSPSWKRVGWWATTPIGGSTSYTLSFTLPKDRYNPKEFSYLKQSGSIDTLELFGSTYPVTSNLHISR